MDYSSVESAGLGWVAKCERLLNVFREGLDPYKDFGAALYKKPYDAITRAERQICKPAVLGCGYRLSAGKIVDGQKTGLLAYAENMGVELSEQESIDSVRVFRETYSEIPQFWYACERAIRHVLTTHTPFDLGYARFEWLKPYLLAKLPSGRYIYYYKPRLEQRVVNTGRTKVIRSHGMAMHGVPEGVQIEVPDTYVKTIFTYMGRNQRTTQWDRIEGHGGVTTENLVQALTRDILKVGLTRLHEDGWEIVGHSHDEAICLTKIGDNYHSIERMRELFVKPIDWAPGFPLDARGYVAPFYRK
jgi:DNA polymerase